DKIQNIKSQHVEKGKVYAGGFSGVVGDSSLDGIRLSQIKNIEALNSDSYAGGFAGAILGGKYSKIYISGIKNISSKSIDKSDDLSSSYNAYAGGFVGLNNYGKFSDITVKNIGNISSVSDVSEDAYASAGGFVGNIFGGDFERISLERINNVSSIASSSNVARAYSGGFAGSNITYNNGVDKSPFNINNISLKRITNITGEANKNAYAGGFVASLGSRLSIYFLKNIYIEGIDHIKANSGVGAYAGGFAGNLDYVDIDNVELNNIKEINAEASNMPSAGGFVGYVSRYSNFENIVLNDFGSISAKDSAGGFVGHIANDDREIQIIFNNISLNNFGSIIAKDSAGGFVGYDVVYDRGVKMSNISLNDINYIQGDYAAGGFSGHSETRSDFSSYYENIVLNNIKHIKGKYAGGFTGYGAGGKNIYIYFDKGAIIEGSESSGKFFGHLNEYYIPDTENTYIYYYKDDLANATADQKYWGNEIQLHPYDDNSQGYIDFKTAALAALNGLKEIDCGAGKKCLVFTSDFKVDNPNITSPDIPDFNAKPLIPNTEDIINKKVVLDENDILDSNVLNKIISELKDKFYVVDINTLNDLLKAYAKIDKDNPTSKAEFLANYL
ncbi:hypothetical protein KJQ64_08040, partial [Campylobacter lari]|nr:hypothetical protein [Campylobacter lari]